MGTTLDRNITVSGTDPSNPKCAADLVDRLEGMRKAMAAMYTEVGRLQVYAGGIRDVLHYDQSWPDKRAQMRAQEVTGTIKMLRDDMEALHDQIGRVAGQISDSGVNMKGSFTWRSPAERRRAR